MGVGVIDVTMVSRANFVDVGMAKRSPWCWRETRVELAWEREWSTREEMRINGIIIVEWDNGQR